MIVLLVHLTSHAIEVGLMRPQKKSKTAKKSDIFLLRSLPLHDNLKMYLSDAHAELSKTQEKIDQVMCILGPSFSTTKTDVIKYSEEKPFRIDVNLIKKITAGDGNGFEIEKEILQIKANGYSTPHPMGKSASSIEVTVYQSSSPQEIIDEIKDHILPISKEIVFHTFPYITYKVLCSQRPELKAFLLVEVDRMHSIFSLIEENVFLESVNINKGEDFIISEIETILNVDEQAARVLIAMKNDGTLDEKTGIKLQEALLSALTKWSKDAYEVLRTLHRGVLLPRDMYLIAPKILNDAFKECLMKNDYSSFTYDEGGFHVDISDFKDLADKVVLDVLPPNPLLMILDALFVEMYV